MFKAHRGICLRGKYRERLDGTWFILYILSLRIHNSFTAPSISLAVAEFIDPWLGDKVNSGIGLSYRTASPCSLAGRYNNPMPELAISPQSGSMKPKQTSCCCYARWGVDVLELCRRVLVLVHGRTDWCAWSMERSAFLFLSTWCDPARRTWRSLLTRYS